MFLALLLRVALLLGATPVGIMMQEILYLRADVFRPLLRLVLVFLVLEAAQFGLPALGLYGVLPAAWAELGSPSVDLAQAALLVLIGAGALRALGPYSRRSLAELETLARRSVEALAGRIVRRTERRPRPRREA